MPDCSSSKRIRRCCACWLPPRCACAAALESWPHVLARFADERMPASCRTGWPARGTAARSAARRSPDLPYGYRACAAARDRPGLFRLGDQAAVIALAHRRRRRAGAGQRQRWPRAAGCARRRRRILHRRHSRRCGAQMRSCADADPARSAAAAWLASARLWRSWPRPCAGCRRCGAVAAATRVAMHRLTAATQPLSLTIGPSLAHRGDDVPRSPPPCLGGPKAQLPRACWQ